MRAYIGNPELIGFTAITDFGIGAINNPVHPALARTKNAIPVGFEQIHPDP